MNDERRRIFTDADIEAIRAEHRRELDRATSAPIDWPARFRAAADAAERAHWYGTAEQLRDLASHLTGTASRRTRVVEAIGLALTGEDERPAAGR